jgi:hypothetical protein
MTPLLNCLLAAALALAVAGQAHAQPKDAYWVIESNVNNPGAATVYFYNRHHQLIYKEAVKGITLDVSKGKVRRQLNSVLKQSVALWKQQSGQLLAKRIQ